MNNEYLIGAIRRAMMVANNEAQLDFEDKEALEDHMKALAQKDLLPEAMKLLADIADQLPLLRHVVSNSEPLTLRQHIIDFILKANKFGNAENNS